MPARRFLWVVAALVVLVLAVALVWRLAGRQMLARALVPTVGFAALAPPPAPDYRRAAAWAAGPGRRDDPARWTPPDYRPAPQPAAALFFIGPTAFVDRARWNAPVPDPDTDRRLDDYLRMQASVFNGIAEVWSPRYRQATFGAFLAPGPDADRALALAYSDVERAFDVFLARHPAGPIILAGHSQGSRHLLHLVSRRGALLSGRLVAIYAAGWPVTARDARALGIPPCTARAQAGCIASWQSYAADGDLADARAALEQVADLAGRPLGPGHHLLCTNPLTGAGGSAGPEAATGTLIAGRLEPHRAGARCDSGGLLLLDPAPRDIGPFVLPGGNYHFYDYALFWANLRADAEARLAAYAATRLGAP